MDVTPLLPPQTRIDSRSQARNAHVAYPPSEGRCLQKRAQCPRQASPRHAADAVIARNALDTPTTIEQSRDYGRAAVEAQLAVACRSPGAVLEGTAAAALASSRYRARSAGRH